MKTRKLFLAILMLLITAIAVVTVACNNKDLPEGPETGVYYSYAEDDEDMLTLFGGNKFTLAIKGKSLSGTYGLGDGKLTLTPNKEGENELQGEYDGVNITLTYENTQLKFWKNIEYTVTFDYGEGEIQNVTVKNGKKLVAPNDPEKAGNAFLGWFKEDDTPFGFDAERITDNITLHAKWRSVSVGSNEYIVRFDVGEYEGAVDPEAQTTRGGTVISLEEPQRDGYSFQGWWVSYYDDAEKLAYRLTTDTEITQNMTVYALWTGRNENVMLPEVKSDSITWQNVSGISTYNVEVRKASGESVFTSSDMSGNKCDMNWNSLEAGDYIVELKGGSESETRYYRNKALDRVSLFEIVGSTLKYNKVANATTYYLSIECGDKNHKHDRLNNGPSATYNFENCPMDDNGKITFRVIATASGYAESISEAYEFERMLEPIGENDYVVDNDNETVVWNDVPNATGYNVLISCGDDAHEHVYNGIDTSISYKECAQGKIVIEIAPVSKGYGTPAARRIEIDKQTLSTPSGIKLIGNTMTWNNVQGARSYSIQVNNAPAISKSDASFDITEVLTGMGERAKIRITAIGENDNIRSLPTEEIDVIYNQLDDTSIAYYGGMLHWTYVGGAVRYEITVNDINTSYAVGVNQSKVTLTREGENKISLCYIDADNIRSDVVELTVEANKIVLNAEDGKIAGEQRVTLYKAPGDDMTDLPVPKLEGKAFGGWYNTPNGANGNGSKYSDKIFAGGGDLNLYADWQPMSYNVTFALAGESIDGELPDDIVIKSGMDFTLPTVSSSNKYKSFIGWSSVRNSIGKRVTDDNGNSLRPWNLSDVNDDGKIVLYPIFAETLQYELNNGTYTVSKNPAGIHFVTSVKIPDEVDGIPVSIIGDFTNCVNLKRISVPNTVTSIDGNTIFDGCTALEDIDVYEVSRNGKYSSENGALIYTEDGVKNMIYLPLGVKGRYEIPDDINALGASLFESREITEVRIPGSVKEIGVGAFRNCKNLNKVEFENGTEDLVVYSQIFANCISLKEVKFPSNFKIYTVEATDPSFETEGPITFYDLFVGCTNLEAIKFDSDHKTYSDVDGVVYTKRQDTLIAYPIGKKGDFTVTSATTIGSGAFEGVLYLENVTLANTVQYIDEYAFQNVRSLKTISIPNSLIEIKDHAFYRAYSLKTVNINSDNSRLRKIGFEAFCECGALESISLPNSVTIIGRKAFFMCESLKTVTASGTKGAVEFDEENKNDYGIGTSAFSGCKNLTSVTIPGSIAILGYRSFADLASLTRVVIPDSVKIIDIQAFASDEGDSVLSNVEIGSGIEEIACEAFSNCDKLVSFTLPAGLTEEKVGRSGMSGPQYNPATGLPAVNDQGQVIMTTYRAAFNGCDGIKIVYNLTGKTLTAGSDGFGEVARNALTVSTSQPPADGDVQDPADKSIIRQNGFVFWVENGAISLVGYTGENVELTLPDTIGGKNYVIGSGAFENNKSIQTVTLGSGVTSIASNAFTNCTNLIRITLGSGLKTIENGAFTNCTALFEICNRSRDITITLKANTNGSIALNARYVENLYNNEEFVSKLKLVDNYYIFDRVNDEYVLIKYTGGSDPVLPDGVDGEDYSIDASAFTGATITSIVFGRGVKAIPDKLFSNKNTIQSVTVIGNGDTTIGSQAFYCVSNPALKSVTIGSGVKSIGAQAFTSFNASTIVELTIENGLESIGSQAFQRAAITSLTIPSSVVTIGDNAFDSCASLVQIEILGQGNTVIGKNAFSSCRKLKYIEMDGVVKIDESAFKSCEAITDIFIPDSVTTIANSAFDGCANLESVLFGKGITSLGNNVFSNCPIKSIVLTEGATTVPENLLNGVSIKTFVIPESITTISKNAFKGALIINIDIPDNVTEICEGAFASCKNLMSITLGTGLKTIADKAFDGCESLYEIYNMSKLNIRLGRSDNGGIALHAKYIHRSLSEESIILNTDDGLLFVQIDDNWTLVSYSGSVATLTLPDIGKEYVIGDEVFRENYNLTSVTIPEGVTAIGNRAFWSDSTDLGATYSKLQSIQFPSTLKSIGSEAFYRNGNLTSITLPHIETIGNNAFELCVGLRTVNLGDSLVSVATNAFQECTALQRVSFPESLQRIANDAFVNCSALKGITFNGSANIASGAFRRCANVEWIVLGKNMTGLTTSAFSVDTSIIDIFFYGTKSEFTSDAATSGFGTVYYYEASEPATSGNYWRYVNDTPTKWA